LIWGGILFIVLGGFALAYRGFNYSHEDKVLVGPIHATADKHEHVDISPLLGGLAENWGADASVAGGPSVATLLQTPTLGAGQRISRSHFGSNLD
jgi:hypothetical protein